MCSLARAALLGVILLVTPVASAQPAVDPTAALLQEIIRQDTSNPPGNEGKVDELLAAKLRPLGFEVTIVPTPQPGKPVASADPAKDQKAESMLAQAQALASKDPSRARLLCRQVAQMYTNNASSPIAARAIRMMNSIRGKDDDED